MDFPAMFYKPAAEGEGIRWEGKWFETLVVGDEDDAEIALSDGWMLPRDAAKTIDATGEEPKRKAK